MDQIKRLLGYLWMIIGPLTIMALLWGAITLINAGDKDIHKPLPWIIIITIFTPIAIGLTIFGWYAAKGEYDGEIKT